MVIFGFMMPTAHRVVSSNFLKDFIDRNKAGNKLSVIRMLFCPTSTSDRKPRLASDTSMSIPVSQSVSGTVFNSIAIHINSISQSAYIPYSLAPSIVFNSCISPRTAAKAVHMKCKNNTHPLLSIMMNQFTVEETPLWNLQTETIVPPSLAH